MKSLCSFVFGIVFLVLSFAAFLSPAHADGWVGRKFHQEVFVAFGGNGTNGSSPQSAIKCDAANGTSLNLWAIPAGALIERVYVVVDTAITGTTAINVGDDDGSSSFVPTAAITYATPGVYGWDAKSAGAYMRIQTAGATDAGDIYVVPNSKYYTVGTKTVKAAITGNCTAGRWHVVIEGTLLGVK